MRLQRMAEMADRSINHFIGEVKLKQEICMCSFRVLKKKLLITENGWLR